MSNSVNFTLSLPLCYSLKTRSYGMREKKIFCIYGCFSVSCYINGGFLDTHVCINNPHWQSSEIIVFLCKYYIVISNTLIGWRVLFVPRSNIIIASWETKTEGLTYRKKVHTRKIRVRNITFLAVHPSFYVIFLAFFVYSLPFPKWRTY